MSKFTYHLLTGYRKDDRPYHYEMRDGYKFPHTAALGGKRAAKALLRSDPHMKDAKVKLIIRKPTRKDRGPLVSETTTTLGKLANTPTKQLWGGGLK